MNQISKKIDFWIQNNQNVLFIGKHGTGKTSLVKEAFESHSLNYRYFSASTMDPWVDFVGVPKENIENKIPDSIEAIKELAKIDIGIAEEWVIENWKLSLVAAKRVVDYSINRTNGTTYLELVKPYSFATGQVEALFFDEFNRSPKKVRNAVMELLQFKSINGFKFPNLRLVWAAINPEDEEQTYDVERLDPAQKDRFHVSVEIPYQPNSEWFRKEYGKRIADSAIQWWNELPTEEKDKVSPRRLQYALDTHKNKGDLRDVLPSSCNVSKLHSVLASGPTLERLEELIKNNNEEESKNFLNNENNYSSAIKYILKSEYLQNYFLPLIPKEKIAVLLSEEDKALQFIVKNCSRTPVFKQVCEDIIKANTNTKLVKKLRKSFTELQTISSITQEKRSKKVEVFFNQNASYLDWPSKLKEAEIKISPPAQLGIIEPFKIIENNIPPKMTGADAVKCLEVISKINFQINDIVSSTIMPDSTIKNLIPIINHCLIEGCKNCTFGSLPNPIPLDEFLSNNSQIIYNLFSKLKLAGCMDLIFTNESQIND